MVTISKKSTSDLPFGISDLIVTKKMYKVLSQDFHQFHQHDLNCLFHMITTTLGVWGAIQLADTFDFTPLIYGYAVLVALTTPLATAVLHTALVYGCVSVSPITLATYITPAAVISKLSFDLQDWHVCLFAIVAGFGLQDLSHYLCCEQTFMNHYLSQGKSWMLLVHSLYLLPLVIDSITVRSFFLPHVVSRNRNIVCNVKSRKAIEQLREWIHNNVPSTPETTHVWPHKQDGTHGPALELENDPAIQDAFRTVFLKQHYDIKVVQEMNEIYVTAVGAKRAINSDAVFYTPHTDGPYWFLPGASLYRVLVGVTPNEMVRTRFNLQHETQDQVLDMYGVVGFDYNRELHWIDHVPGKSNKERRSLVKLHFIVYPKGWHRYGALCAFFNTSYNTWARGNFLQTLRPTSAYDFVMAWWIWLTTWGNAMFEEYIGWSNLVYVAASYMAGPTAFLLLTSFRHYLVYVTTFAFRAPPVAHGYLMRDSKLYKTISMMHVARRLLPMVGLPRDWPGVSLAIAGFSITMLATARLGMVRTYFGSELDFVKPEWINGFPYGTIPHPMIVGQLVAFGSILWWFALSPDNVRLLVAHMTCYTVHMFQEILFSSY
jgi:hypothetical protein